MAALGVALLLLLVVGLEEGSAQPYDGPGPPPDQQQPYQYPYQQPNQYPNNRYPPPGTPDASNQPVTQPLTPTPGCTTPSGYSYPNFDPDLPQQWCDPSA